MKKHQRRFLFALLIITSNFFLYGNPSDFVRETVIENGMSVFTLEDLTSPLVRMELCVKAGFSSQTNRNAGFIQLLASLIEKSAPNITFSEINCGADSTRFVIQCSPSAINRNLENLSEAVFSPYFSDNLLKSELASMKREVLQNAQDPVHLINSSIDARVFEDEPWRHDSGVYPALFASFSDDEIRTGLAQIQEEYFTPQNSALFVSGNIRHEILIEETKNTFGRFFSTARTLQFPMTVSATVHRKFVIHDPQFSEELTQVVAQYASLDSAESYLASLIYNNNPSSFKNDILAVPDLNIPGDEYIDVSPASESGCSRLMVQSILQTSKKKNPVMQSEDFFSYAEKAFSSVEHDEYEAAIRRGIFDNFESSSSSADFMDKLSQFWAVEKFNSQSQSAGLNESRTVENYLLQNERFKTTSINAVMEKLSLETPFIFVIINTKVYNRYKSEFKANGYEEVSSRNGSWYTKSLYKNITDLKTTQKRTAAILSKVTPEKDFYETNRASVKSYHLSNGIPLYIRKISNTTGVSLVLSVSGGALSSVKDPGFEDVMVNLLALNIMRQISAKQKNGLVDYDFNIYAETFPNYSHIVIECSSSDLIPVLSACSSALVFDDIMPADADRVVQNRRTRKRLYNGSMENQLFSAAVSEITASDASSDLKKIYDAKGDILTDTTYEKILQNYPYLLDAARFSIVVSGNMSCSEEDFYHQAEKAFSLLQRQSEIVKSKKTDRKNNQKEINIVFPYGKTQRVKLVHTFLTDIPAKDAGPMPAVLIPTKNFSDPVMFCAGTQRGEEEPADAELIDAVLFYLQDKLAANIAEKNGLTSAKVSVSRCSDDFNMAALIFSSVDKTTACDTLYSQVYEEMLYELSNTMTVAQTTQKIKDLYVEKLFGKAINNSGAAILVEESLYETDGNDAVFWLEKYRKVSSCEAEGFLYTLKKYFAFEDLFRLYSADSRK